MHHLRALVLLPVVVLAVSAFGATDEGRLYKAVVYMQNTSGVATLNADPYTFIADIRNTFPGASGTITAPAPSTYTPNPFMVQPGNLVGAHYLYSSSYATEDALNTAFANGTYSFNVVRNYGVSGTTTYSAPVAFSGSKAIPTTAPVITNTTWNAGTLLIQPAQATITYTTTSGVGFAYELVGSNGSGGGSGTATGSLDLIGRVGFGKTYTGEMRLTVTDQSIVVNDPLASHDQNSTYSTLTASIVQFTLTTPAAAGGFGITSAVYTANGTDYDVLSLLNSKISENNVIYRMDGNELTNNQAGFSSGVLHISYFNNTGTFAGDVAYNPSNFSGNYLVMPNPLQAVPEPATVALLGLAVVMVLLGRKGVSGKSEGKREGSVFIFLQSIDFKGQWISDCCDSRQPSSSAHASPRLPNFPSSF